jgi:hypothetical protein
MNGLAALINRPGLKIRANRSKSTEGTVGSVGRSSTRFNGFRLVSPDLQSRAERQRSEKTRRTHVFLAQGFVLRMKCFASPMKCLASPMKHFGFPMKHFGFPMKHFGFPMKRFGFPMKRFASPMKCFGFPMKRFGFLAHIFDFVQN